MIALILAAYLHRPPVMVEMIYAAGGTDAVAVVECESQFNPQAFRYEKNRSGRIIGTSWGLFQLFDRYHAQWRYDLGRHIAEGAAFLAECEAKTHGDFAAAVSLYNSGSPSKALAWGRHVARVRDDLAHWLWMALR